MAKSPNNIHSGHRAKVRARYLESGLTSMPEHNILELMLFYSIPLKDTNDFAHNLLDCFGSLENVFEASEKELVEVVGISEDSATMIKMFSLVKKRYDKIVSTFKSGEVSMYDCDSFITNQFHGLNETYMLFCFDVKNCLCDIKAISPEYMNEDSEVFKNCVQNIFRNSVSSVILAHNRMNNIVNPSSSDIALVKNFSRILRVFEIELFDYFIISKIAYVSLRNQSSYSPLFRWIF